jgi:hypothetical protein
MRCSFGFLFVRHPKGSETPQHRSSTPFILLLLISVPCFSCAYLKECSSSCWGTIISVQASGHCHKSQVTPFFIGKTIPLISLTESLYKSFSNRYTNISSKADDGSEEIYSRSQTDRRLEEADFLKSILERTQQYVLHSLVFVHQQFCT